MNAEDEMVQGYMDGFDLSSPEPSSNRSYSYRHGFKNGRADKSGKPFWSNIQEARDLAEVCIAADNQGLIQA